MGDRPNHLHLIRHNLTRSLGHRPVVFQRISHLQLNLKKPNTMTASTPLQIDGKQYDRYSLNLAITGFYKPEGQPDANVAMSLIPTRVEDGVVEQAGMEHRKAVVLGSLSQANAEEQTAIGAIQAALQAYLQAKGL
jgi:hypothetical protein